MGALSALKKAKPLVSKFDEALANLQRPKGTGNEFLTEVMKQAGVKKAEVEDRKLRQAFEKAGKITKEQAQEIARKNAPAKLEEKTLREPSLKEIESHANDAAYQDAVDQARDQGYRGGELDEVAEEIHEDIMSDPDRIGEYMDRAAEDLMEGGFAPSHGELTLPGGENYREILLKMPAFAGDKKIMELEAMRRRVDPEFHSHRYQDLTQQIDALKAEKAQHPEQFQGVSAHFAGEPGIIASLRVKDRIVPTYTTEQAKEIGQRIADSFGVADHKNLGNGSVDRAIRDGVVTPKEAAQYADYRGFQGVDTTGAKQKVLHIEEIQSDWHQKGRSARNEEVKRVMKEQGITKKEANALVPEDFGYRTAETEARRKELMEIAAPYIERNEAIPKEIYNELTSLPNDLAPPDAPFKKNWQELALKKALNYAVENGYDKIAITPGAEQASRYSLSNKVNQVEVYKLDNGMYNLEVIGKNGKPISIPDSRSVDQARISEIVGKDVAERAIGQADQAGNSVLSGLDLEIGGEGMKGFYDKMLPDYLNTLGKKYGAQMGVYEMPNPKTGLSITDIQREQGMNEQQWLDLSGDEKMRLIDEMDAKAKAHTTPLHTFDITPQLREEVTTRGLPLYQQIGMPLGAGAAASELELPEPEYAEGGAVNFNTTPDMHDGGAIIQGAPFKRGGKVKITDNLDEMFMEVNNKKFQRK